MKILVFVSKWIGNELLGTLLSYSNNEDYVFIVSNPNADEIINNLNKNGHHHKMLNQNTIDWILEKNDNYFDWLLNLWGGHIFSKELLLKTKNSLNVHPSLLPFGRGRDSIVWTIRNEKLAGVTLHKISNKLDEGDIFFQEQVEYSFPITGRELYKLVVSKCIKVFEMQWPIILKNKNYPTLRQPESDYPTFSRKDLNADSLINLNNNNYYKELILQALAYDFGNDYSLKLSFNDRHFSLRLLLEEINLEQKDE